MHRSLLLALTSFLPAVALAAPTPFVANGIAVRAGVTDDFDELRLGNNPFTGNVTAGAPVSGGVGVNNAGGSASASAFSFGSTLRANASADVTGLGGLASSRAEANQVEVLGPLTGGTYRFSFLIEAGQINVPIDGEIIDRAVADVGGSILINSVEVGASPMRSCLMAVPCPSSSRVAAVR